MRCVIESISYLNHDTRRVLLRTPQPISFYAGQYLEVVLADRRCPFSIASTPYDDSLIELHIRPTPNSEESDSIENVLDTASFLDINLPLGHCFMKEPPSGPLLLIAASTGITQMKSITETLQRQNFAHDIHLYWGVLKEEDIYLKDLFEEIENTSENFNFIPVVSEPNPGPSWQGEIGLVGKVALRKLLKDNIELEKLTVFVSGGPAMVYATLDMFIEHGLPKKNMHSDMFTLVPRE
ncbi:MAG: CDP-4-dehydro-6-deoxyglucose reductase [Flavobacterium sp.]|jgi:CDP-4-dehydro-6-deoxyglucose reductase